MPLPRTQILIGSLAFLLSCARPTLAQDASPPTQPERPKAEEKDDDLARKLLRQAQSGDDEDLMEAIMRLMEESATNMEVKLDPGAETQKLQQETLAKLDEAIKAAAARRRPMRPPCPKPHQDRRRSSDGSAQRGKDEQAGKQGRSSGEESPGAKGAAVKPVELPDGELIDVRRAWGHLPTREREEIIQGAGEEFLEKYREWVERYYRALQESASEPK